MYLRLLLLFVMLACVAVQPAFADLTRITDSVYAYVGEKDASPGHSFAANAGIVIGTHGVLVVDTLISAKEGQRFLADIRKVTNKPITYVVNTHTHLDHALGNCVFAGLGAQIVAQEDDRTSLLKNGADLLRHSGSYGLKPEDMAGTSIAVPTIAFHDRMMIDLGGVEVQLLRTAPSHTAGSLVVWLPQDKVLFTGDILFTDFHPYMADGDMSGWQSTLGSLLALGADKIIPGHAPLSGNKDLREMKEYLALFDSTAKALAAEGQDADAITKVLLQKLPKRALAEWMVGHNVKSRYRK